MFESSLQNYTVT